MSSASGRPARTDPIRPRAARGRVRRAGRRRVVAAAAVLVVGAAPAASAAADPPGPAVAPTPAPMVATAVVGRPSAVSPRALPAGAVALPHLWRWPLLPAPRVVRAFDPPAQPWLAGHRGVDLAAVPGQPVLSAGTGVVVFAGPLAGRGVVSVEHGGIRMSYEPVVPLVAAGDPVIVGQPVALVAPLPGHCGVRTCLHWGAFVTLSVPRRYIDPRVLVGAGPVRLVPAGARGVRALAPSSSAEALVAGSATGRTPAAVSAAAPTAVPLPVPASTGAPPTIDPRTSDARTSDARASDARASLSRNLEIPIATPPSSAEAPTALGTPAAFRPGLPEAAAMAMAMAGLGTLGGALAVGLTGRSRRRR